MAQPVLHGGGDAPDLMGEKAIRSHIEALNLKVGTAYMHVITIPVLHCVCLEVQLPTAPVGDQ